mgnify:CR=1 FL=1
MRPRSEAVQPVPPTLLLDTKLYVPPPPRGLVPRSRLSERELLLQKSQRRIGRLIDDRALVGAFEVDDVDAHYEQARGAGAEIEYEPMDQPYGVREYGAIDPEGHRWAFVTPLG